MLDALNQQTDPPSVCLKTRNPSGRHDHKEGSSIENIKLFIIFNELEQEYTQSNKKDGENKDENSAQEQKRKEELLADFRKKAKKIFSVSGSSDISEITLDKKIDVFLKEFICSEVGVKTSKRKKGKGKNDDKDKEDVSKSKL